MGKLIHYIVTSPVNDYEPSHLHAQNQEEAIRLFVEEAENPHGYSRDFYDTAEIYVVPDSTITRWRVELIPPPEPPPETVRITKQGMGT